LDLASAYDRVDINILIGKLVNRNIDGYLINVINSMFSCCASQAVINGELSDPIPRTRGLFQGSILSPILFNIYIDDLAEKLNESDTYCLLFADDILLQTQTSWQMQQLLIATQKWCEDNRMAVNVNKCGTFSNGPTINSEPIPVVENYKYLGIHLNKDGIDVDASIEHSRKRTVASLLNLKQHIGSEHWTPMTKIGMYKTFIRPKMEYGAPIINRLLKKQHIKTLEGIQRDALKWIIGKSQPINVIRNLTNILTIKDRYDQLQAMYRVHINCTPSSHLINRYIQKPKGTLKRTLRLAYSGDIDKSSILEHYKEKNLSMDLSMVKVIDSKTRNKAGIDKILDIKHRPTLRNAIKWRLNAYPRNLICNKCKKYFNRKHVNTCIPNLVPKNLRLEFKEAKYKAKVDSFNQLDYFLNARNIKLFRNGVKAIINNTTTQKDI
jgi:Reverse transcriptase (RNA-dependent DNA polymerase)